MATGRRVVWKSRPVALICSRKFNPGHFSHIVANYKMLSEHGFDAFMLLHPKFLAMAVTSRDRIVCGLERWSARESDVVIVWFPSLRAVIDLIWVRLTGRANVVYIFHEPFDSIQAYVKSGFGFRKTVRVCLIGIVSYAIVILADKVVLGSDKGIALFRRRYLHTGRQFARFPLMFDDEAAGRNLCINRVFISYIGTIAEDHAFIEFLEFVAYAVEQDLFPDHKFLIATSSALPAFVGERIKALTHSGRLAVRGAAVLSNEEINQAYFESRVVWNAYKRSTQSGVLPKAYMFGTPVLVSNINRSEFFRDHETGVALASYDVAVIRRAIHEIIGRFALYSANCRSLFLSTFYYRAQSAKFIKFLVGKAAGG